MLSKKWSLAASLPVFALTANMALAETNEPIPFAVVGPITGPQAAVGEDMVRAAKAAIKKINSTGGVLNHPVTLEIGDDRCDGKEAVSAANKLVGDGVQFVIGHYCTAGTVPASSVYNEAGMLQITMSQGMKVTQQNYSNLFRITPNADELAKGYMDTVQAEYEHGNNKIAIISTKSDYGTSISLALKAQLEKRGIPVTELDYYNDTDKDYSSLITAMKFSGINLVLLSGGEDPMGAIIRQSEGQGFKPQYIVSSTALSTGFVMTAGGCAAEGVKTVAAWNPLYLPGESNEKLRKDFQEEGVGSIDTAINVYSAFMAMAQAVKKGGTIDQKTGLIDTKAVEDTLHSETFDVPTGKIRFTATGELVEPMVIVYEFQPDNQPCQTVHPHPVGP